MNHVQFKPHAEEQITTIYLRELHLRNEFTRILETVERDLQFRPLQIGESRSGNVRVLIVEWVAVFYAVISDDNRVEVLDVKSI
jgi:hypothetical protein